MRLLIITQYFWPENFRINDLTSELASRGHKVTVLTGTAELPIRDLYLKNLKLNLTHSLKYNGSKSYYESQLFQEVKITLQLFFNYLSFILTASSFGLYRLRGHAI
jgi:hypothetical protein